jgi:hypothetical protein
MSNDQDWLSQEDIDAFLESDSTNASDILNLIGDSKTTTTTTSLAATSSSRAFPDIPSASPTAELTVELNDIVDPKVNNFASTFQSNVPNAVQSPTPNAQKSGLGTVEIVAIVSSIVGVAIIGLSAFFIVKASNRKKTASPAKSTASNSSQKSWTKKQKPETPLDDKNFNIFYENPRFSRQFDKK